MVVSVWISIWISAFDSLVSSVGFTDSVAGASTGAASITSSCLSCCSVGPFTSPTPASAICTSFADVGVPTCELVSLIGSSIELLRFSCVPFSFFSTSAPPASTAFSTRFVAPLVTLFGASLLSSHCETFLLFALPLSSAFTAGLSAENSIFGLFLFQSTSEVTVCIFFSADRSSRVFVTVVGAAILTSCSDIEVLVVVLEMVVVVLDIDREVGAGCAGSLALFEVAVADEGRGLDILAVVG